MPKPASEIGSEIVLRALVLGIAKCGKTTSAISSLVKVAGPGYVMCCGDKAGMRQAQHLTKKFTYDVIRDEDDMEAGIKEAKRGSKEGEYKWILVDDYSLYASWLENELRILSASHNAKNEPDGRKVYPEYKSRILNIPRRLFDVRAHVVFAMHYIEPSKEIEGQRPKSGQGIIPMVAGAAREELPALFQDVIWMEKESGSKGEPDKRVFRINPEGVWGPGCYNASGTHTIPADFVEFMKLANGKR